MRPNKDDHIPYFDYYIDLVKENNLIDALEKNQAEFLKLLAAIPAEKENYVYAPGKWTTMQVINHIIDTERIFSYRALRFARGDNQLLRSYDENIYADNANLKNSNIALLRDEFNAVRISTILLFKQLSERELRLVGNLESGQTTVLSLGFVICGHTSHHASVIRERYL